MEIEMGPSSSQKLRRSNREEEYVKLSSALKLATEKKLSLHPKLDSLIQVFFLLPICFFINFRVRNELEEMRQRLEARKMLVEKTSFACKVTEQDVKTKEESLSAEVRSLLVGGTTLSIAKSKLQELNCQLEGESSYTHLKIVTNKLRKRQQYMVSQVSFIYPLKIEAGPSQDQELESLPQGPKIWSDFGNTICIYGWKFNVGQHPYCTGNISWFEDKQDMHKIEKTTKQESRDILGIQTIGGMGSYLTIPENLGGPKTQIFCFIRERLNNRVNGWTIFYERRKKVLIKLVVTAKRLINKVGTGSSISICNDP
ncbi:hypothetical protein Bca52824_001629 [Brassica carinata]|uniref:Uncharacterized protein n=1 Tax=Brassica carinata TaxID=52824 RepID=A0A8X7WGM1_BRACI|nr:hypothetical protein Bca52824_001629 [Brassica carinata]